jgi:hypothetical protein
MIQVRQNLLQREYGLHLGCNKLDDDMPVCLAHNHSWRVSYDEPGALVVIGLAFPSSSEGDKIP